MKRAKVEIYQMKVQICSNHLSFSRKTICLYIIIVDQLHGSPLIAGIFRPSKETKLETKLMISLNILVKPIK